MELFLPPVLPKKRNYYRIDWTIDMIDILKDNFSTSYNKVIAKHIGVSVRSLIRKARELGLEKEEGFLEYRRDEITKMALDAHPPHPFKGVKGWCVPNGENTRFKPGNISIMTYDRNVVERCHAKRNLTIKRDRTRLSLGLDPLTKLIKNNYGNS